MATAAFTWWLSSACCGQQVQELPACLEMFGMQQSSQEPQRILLLPCCQPRSKPLPQLLAMLLWSWRCLNNSVKSFYRGLQPQDLAGGGLG